MKRHLPVLSVAIFIAFAAFQPSNAQDRDRQRGDERAAGASASAEWPSWDAMHREVASARSLLGGNVTAGSDPVGQVRDLVLDESLSTVRYIISDAPYPLSLREGPRGIVAFTEASVVTTSQAETDVAITADTAAQAGTIALDIEPQQQLASRVLGSQLRFAGADELTIKDLLIDRDSGEITHWVVATGSGGLLDKERRTVPAERVSFADGAPSTSIAVRDLDRMQEFNPAYL